MTETLAEDARRVATEVEGVVKASEARLAYRRERGRQLSQAHKAHLGELLGRLDSLREHLRAILEPPADPKGLRERFEALTARLARLEADEDEA